MEPKQFPLVSEGHVALEVGVSDFYGPVVTSEKDQSFQRTCFTVCGMAVCNVLSGIVYGLVDDEGWAPTHLIDAIGRSTLMGAIAFATHFAIWVGDRRRWWLVKSVVAWIVNGLLWALVVADLVLLWFYGTPLSFFWRPIADLPKELRGHEIEKGISGHEIEYGLQIVACMTVGQFLAAGRVKSWSCTKSVLTFLIVVPVVTIGMVQYVGPGEEVSVRPSDLKAMHSMPHLRWVWPAWLLVLSQCFYMLVFAGVATALVSNVRGVRMNLCSVAAVICGILECWWIREFFRYSP